MFGCQLGREVAIAKFTSANFSRDVCREGLGVAARYRELPPAKDGKAAINTYCREERVSPINSLARTGSHSVLLDILCARFRVLPRFIRRLIAS